MKLNETPVRTSKNFNINNIELKDLEIPEIVGEFKNLTSTKNIENSPSDINLAYGLGDVLTNNVKNNSNRKIRLMIESKKMEEHQIEFKFDEQNNILIDNIEIIANENTKSTIIIKYESNSENHAFHNGIIRLIAKPNSNINIIVVNFLNIKSNNFIAIENNIEENAKVNYCIVDFGGKASITNYYSNLIGKESKNMLNTIYLGKENQLFDLNYIGELRGEKSKINIEVQGALKDTAKKHFKGTIDFKKGCKKAQGNENEACMMLSENARSIALPMLLCSEEDVEGNHSTSSGKIADQELFYLMSRGLDEKEAMKMMVKARFNKILETIKNIELKEQILKEIDKRLD